MKYVRVYEGDYVESEYLTTYEDHCRHVAQIQDNGFDFEGCIVKQADTIEELIDEKVLVEEDGYPTLLETVEFDRNIYLRINEYEFATQLPNNPTICGAIWVYDSNGIPTLKPVAKMKGVLPNGKIDWELL